MAEFIVTDISDIEDAGDGLLTLREAIAMANASAGADTIVFDAGLSGQTLHLTSGQLLITGSVTIDGDIGGDGTANIVIDADPDAGTLGNQATSRVFQIGGQNGSSEAFSGEVTLKGLGIRNGVAAGHGGGVLSYGDVALTISDSSISGNAATSGNGGGVWVVGDLTLQAVAVLENSASQSGGGIYAIGDLAMAGSILSNNQATGDGGGIVAIANAVITSSTIFQNTASNGGGLAGQSGDHMVTITGSAILNNTASRSGGGLASQQTVEIDGSLFSGNSSTGPTSSAGGLIVYNGGIVTDTTIVGNTATNLSGGGTFYGITSLDGVTVVNNSAKAGGGLTVFGVASITNSTISGNSATGVAADPSNGAGGIAMFGETLSISNSLIENNSSARDGGGIHSFTGTVTVDSSTLSANSAVRNGGGIHSFGSAVALTNSTVAGNEAFDGAGIYSFGQVSLDHATLTGNEAVNEGGGVHADGLTLNNSILIGNAAESGDTLGDIQLPDLDSTAFSGLNLVGAGNFNGNTGPAVGNGTLVLGVMATTVFADTQLLAGTTVAGGMLNDDGVVLLLGDVANPALDAATGDSPETDQLGNPRFDADGNSVSEADLGANEFVPPNRPPVATDDESFGIQDQADVISIPNLVANDSDADGDLLTITDVFNAVNGTVAIEGNFVRFTPEAGFAGTAGYDYTVADGRGDTDTGHVTIVLAPANAAPVAAADRAATAKDTPVTIAVLANDSDADGDDLAVTGASDPAGGSVVVNPDGTVTYTPDDGFRGQDSFTYTVADGNGGSDTASVSVQVGPAPVRIVAGDGAVISIGGNGDVFGTNFDGGAAGRQDITFVPPPAGVQQAISLVPQGGAAPPLALDGDANDFDLDGSFGRGGDVLRFAGDAGGYTVAIQGVAAEISDGFSSYALPIGTAGLVLLFDDGARTLAFDTGSGEVMLGSQTVTATPAQITAPDDGTQIPDIGNPDTVSRAVLFENAQALLGGTFDVFGTNDGAETVGYVSGDLALDGSFARGGDEVSFEGPAATYSAYLSGTSLILLTPEGQVAAPVGVAGLTLDFAGDERTLTFDAGAGQVMIGDQAITATTAGAAQALMAEGFA